MRRAALVLAVALVLGVPSAAGLAGDGRDLSDQACSPPCGEINPRILFEFPKLSDEPIDLAKGESKTFEGTVGYWTDTDDEGHAPRDPSQPITIQFSFPRLPQWAEMAIEPKQIQVPVNSCADCFKTSTDGSQPTAHFQYTQAINLTVKATGSPQATTGYDYGKLQLFAKSTESGIYNPGYGIREVKVTPGTGDDLQSQSTEGDNPVPSAGAIAALATVAGTALVLRRRA